MSSDDEVSPASARRRVPHFERPRHPHDWRFWVGGLGKTLITLGLLMFAFVAYQLWGTGLQTARSQDTLKHQFDSSTLPPTTTTEPANTIPGESTSSTSSTTTTVPVAPATVFAQGSAVAILQIPKIHLDWAVVQGVTVRDLRKGPGHYPDTPMPGQLGNAAIAGHRTTYGGPFYDLDKLGVGDLIEVTTKVGHYTYAVTSSEVVSPTQYDVIATKHRKIAELTLTTCTPLHSATHRLIIHARIVPGKSDQVYAPPSVTAPATSAPATTTPSLPGDGGTATTVAGATTTSTATTVTTTTLPGSVDAFSVGWFDDSSAIWGGILWGLALLAAAVASYWIGRRYRRVWVCFAVGTLPCLVLLYFFFENLNRLLPASL